MTDKFIDDVLSEINKFRLNPSSKAKSLEVAHRGMSRLIKNDPFVDEMSQFIKEIPKLPKMKSLKMNPTLMDIAKSELTNAMSNENYTIFQTKENLLSILPPDFAEGESSLIVDSGADSPDSVVSKILLNRSDIEKFGRKFLTYPNYTQIGIAYAIINEEEDEKMVLLICTENAGNEIDVNKSVSKKKGKKKYEIKIEREEYYNEEEVNNNDNENKGNDDEAQVQNKSFMNVTKSQIFNFEDTGELKQAFDLFDRDNKGQIKTEECVKAMKSMKFDESDPILYTIVSELNNKYKEVTWPQFYNHIVKRLNNRYDEGGLKTIFDLFIENPQQKTIKFDTFKKICREIGENLSDEELKHILSNTTEHGGEITFKDFCEYMKIE